MRKFMLGAYWGARPDSLEGCVYKAEHFFAELTKIDPLLSHWYERGRSRSDALTRKVNTSDAKKLEELFLKGRNRRDVDGVVIEELGFSLSLWNGADIERAEASVRLLCGSCSERVTNNVLVDLPYLPEGSPWVEKASGLLGRVAEIWHPQWAGVMSKNAMREREFGIDRPIVDWMVYVPRSIEAASPPARVEILNDLGSIIVVQPNPPTGEESDLSHIQQVERLLVR